MDILHRYSKEIEKIYNELLRLEKGKIYELDQTHGYPSYATIANDIRSDFDKLLYMIENNEESVIDKLREIEKKL